MNLDEVRKMAMDALSLSEKATPGPWKAYDWPGFPSVDEDSEGCVRIESKDTITAFCFNGHPNHTALFIAESRSLLPVLATEVLNLLEENKVMREALRFFSDDHSYNALCPVKDKDGKFIAWGESLVHKIGEEKAREALAKADGIRNGDKK